MDKGKWFNILVKICGLIASILVVILAYDWFVGFDSYHYDNSYSYFPESCNVGVVKLRGDLHSYLIDDDLDYNGNSIFDEVSSEHIRQGIEYFSDDDQFDMIVLDIDSYGGSPFGAEEIMNALVKSDKETIALIREGGISAAYYAAIGADKIIASKMSDIGSIGVTMSYLNYAAQNKANGIKYEELATGKFKNSGDPDKELTDEERELFMRDLQKIHDYFVADVAKYRNLDAKKVEELADGSSMLGEQALKEGLIDEIGDLDTVKQYFLDKYGYEANFCVY